jgi:phage terminase small subunit
MSEPTNNQAPQTFDDALAALPAKRRVFVLAYLDCLNATEAARRAEYTHPNVQGTRLLVNVSIREALRLGMAERTMPRDEVLARLTMLATASLEDFITLPIEPGSDDTELPDEAKAGEQPAMPHHWRLDLAKAKRRGKLGALKKLKWGEHGPEIELHDPQTPLGLLAKHYGLVVERTRAEPDGPPIDWDRVSEDDQIAFLEGRLTLADVAKRLQPRS